MQTKRMLLGLASAFALAVIATAAGASASALGERTYGGFSGYKAASTWSVPTLWRMRTPFRGVGDVAADVLVLAPLPLGRLPTIPVRRCSLQLSWLFV